MSDPVPSVDENALFSAVDGTGAWVTLGHVPLEVLLNGDSEHDSIVDPRGPEGSDARRDAQVAAVSGSDGPDLEDLLDSLLEDPDLDGADADRDDVIDGDTLLELLGVWRANEEWENSLWPSETDDGDDSFGFEDLMGASGWDTEPAVFSSGAAAVGADSFDGIIISVSPVIDGFDEEAMIPTWWVNDPKSGKSAIVTLAEALYGLDADQRSEAVRAHLGLLADLTAHEEVAATVAAGDEGDPRCVACVTEPDVHAAVLYDAICERARELAEAYQMYPMRVVFEGDGIG